MTRASDVNSPFFGTSDSAPLKSLVFFIFFCFHKYGPALHYSKLEKNNSPRHRFTKGDFYFIQNT